VAGSVTVKIPGWLGAQRPLSRPGAVVAILFMVSNTTPPGFGHTFAAEHYIDAWLALIEPAGWPSHEVSRLKAQLAEEH
jgi:uncharacterized membrane protein